MSSKLLYALLPLFFLSCRQELSPFIPELIAHAGGCVDGYIYTNSLEALEQSVERGYEFIEFDLQFTADSILVAAHSWRDFNQQSGYEHMGDSAPLYDDFVSRRLYGKYRPLTARLIDSVFMANPNICLVTDKISDADVLESNFPQLKERMIVEAFDYNDYVELKKRGFYRVMYSCMADDIYSAVIKHLLLSALFPGDKIEWITLHTSAFSNKLFYLVDLLCNYKAAVFTVNKISDIPQEYGNNIGMIYTDSIIP